MYRLRLPCIMTAMGSFRQTFYTAFLKISKANLFLYQPVWLPWIRPGTTPLSRNNRQQSKSSSFPDNRTRPDLTFHSGTSCNASDTNGTPFRPNSTRNSPSESRKQPKETFPTVSVGSSSNELESWDYRRRCNGSLAWFPYEDPLIGHLIQGIPFIGSAIGKWKDGCSLVVWIDGCVDD